MDVAVYNYLKSVADGSVQAGISTGTLQNGGVGLAPFHDWEGKIPADLKAQLQQASDGIKDGSIKIQRSKISTENNVLNSTGYSFVSESNPPSRRHTWLGDPLRVETNKNELLLQERK